MSSAIAVFTRVIPICFAFDMVRHGSTSSPTAHHVEPYRRQPSTLSIWFGRVVGVQSEALFES